MTKYDYVQVKAIYEQQGNGMDFQQYMNENWIPSYNEEADFEGWINRSECFYED